MRKGQAAMEFLMTYGWAILVVLAAIGALAYFGVLSPSNFLPEQCSLPAQFGCTDTIASSNDQQVRFDLRNGLGQELAELNVTLDSDDCSATPLTANFTNVDARDVVDLVYDCPVAFENEVSGDLIVNYRPAGNDEIRSSEGTLVLKVQ